MKRFLKFIPVALAAVALASCSNDDVLNIGGEEIVKDPSKLYVTVDPLKNGMGDITRSGFVIGTNENGNPLANYFVWTEGDKVKLYDNENNWRPQIWEFDAAATKQYKKVEGFSVFTQNITEEEIPAIKQVGTSVAEQYKNAYGLYPYNLGEFTNETRTKLSFDLGELAFYELEKADETSIYADGQLAKAPIPLWGVATAGEMNVKYMTGILFVDISNLPAADDNKSKYLIIQSIGKTSGKGIKLHGKFDGTTGNEAQVDYDPELLGDETKAPVLKTTNTDNDATDLSAGPLTKTAAEEGTYKDLIIIDLARAGGRTRVAVPIPVADEVQQISAYYTADQTNSGTEITTATATKIGETIEKDVKAGSYYLIQNAGAETISDANTPYQLAQRIKEIDATMDRDYTINISADVNVDDTGADEHGFVLDLSGYSLKHNANIVFDEGKGFKGKTAGANTLTIRTGASDKTMTLTVAEATGAALKAIKVESDEKLAGKVVLKGTLHTIEANSQNLTVGAAATTVNASTTVNIDALGGTITTLNLYKGANQVNVLNGTITSINYTPANTANKAKNVTGTVNVYSEGISGFKAPTATAAAVNGTVTFNFTSKLTAKPSDITTSFSDEDEASIAVVGGYKEIYTAAQLAAIDGTTGQYVIKASEIDLNGSEIAWAPKNLSAEFDGNINANVTADPAPAVVPAVIKNMKVAATTEETPYGLFGTVTGAATAYNIKNLKIQDATIEGATGKVITNAGLLAGKITASSANNDGVNITNITVTGTNKVKTADKTASANLGGLIGAVDHDSKIAKVVLTDVNISGVELKGYKNLGGVIGLVGKFANVKFAASGAGTTASPYKYNSASDITFTSNIISDQTSQDYATRGNFIGSATPDAANNAVIEIEVASHPAIGATAYTREFVMGEWNIMNTTTYANVSYNIVLRQNYIGFAGVRSSNDPDYHTPALVGSTWGVKFTTRGTSGSTKTYIPQITKYVASTDATNEILFIIEK